MAGRGPSPKTTRIRRNADSRPLRVVNIKPIPQPPLADLLGETSPLTDLPWHPATLLLWSQLAEHPATQSLVAAQWSMLARAVMHDDAATQGLAKPSEARLRIANFHIDPADMLRGRIDTAVAEGAETRQHQGEGSRARRGPLKSTEVEAPESDAG